MTLLQSFILWEAWTEAEYLNVDDFILNKKGLDILIFMDLLNSLVEKYR